MGTGEHSCKQCFTVISEWNRASVPGTCSKSLVITLVSLIGVCYLAASKFLSCNRADYISALEGQKTGLVLCTLCSEV